MKGFADLADLHEDDRIRIIGQTAERGERVGFFVNDDAKADRYIKKLTERFRVHVVDRKRDLLANNTVFVAITRRPDASDNPNGSGFLEVGTNEQHEVVVNLPRDLTGHIVFSAAEARALAETLKVQAHLADRARREAEEAERMANALPVDRSQQCTTSGEPVAKVRSEQTESTGQHKAYIVLCDSERAKGFVRPYRDAYKHLTCGSVTTMGRALSETYARDPTFYGATFCCHCNRHLPVSEFVWTADGQQVGS